MSKSSFAVKTTGRVVHFPFYLDDFCESAAAFGHAFSCCYEGAELGELLNYYSGICFLCTNFVHKIWTHSLSVKKIIEDRRLVALPGISSRHNPDFPIIMRKSAPVKGFHRKVEIKNPFIDCTFFMRLFAKCSST